MNKVVGLKLTDKDEKLIKQIEDSGLSNSELIRKALDHYFKSVNSVNQPVNHFQQETEEKPVNQVDQKVNQVNPVQIIDNHEFIEYLKRNDEWLKDRIEHFENTQDKIIGKIDIKTKKELSLPWVRM